MIDDAIAEIKTEMEKHRSNSFESIVFNSGLLCALNIIEKYGKCDNSDMSCCDNDNFDYRRLQRIEDDLK